MFSTEKCSAEIFSDEKFSVENFFDRKFRRPYRRKRKQWGCPGEGRSPPPDPSVHPFGKFWRSQDYGDIITTRISLHQKALQRKAQDRNSYHQPILQSLVNHKFRAAVDQRASGTPYTDLSVSSIGSRPEPYGTSIFPKNWLANKGSY